MRRRVSRPLGGILGAAIREARETRRLRQDDLAAVAREVGLPWTRVTVAAIEIGRRRLTLDEFLLLPAVLNFTELAELFPMDSWVGLTKETSVHSTELKYILSGKAGKGHPGNYDTPAQRKLQNEFPRQQIRDIVQGTVIPKVVEVIRRVWPEVESGGNEFLIQCEMEAKRDAEQKAARRLHVSPFEVALAAQKLWGRSLTAERDRQVAFRETDAAATGRRRAIRGHVTRLLVEEIRPLVTGACEADEG